jgi:hypothetical protein
MDWFYFASRKLKVIEFIGGVMFFGGIAVLFCGNIHAVLPLMVGGIALSSLARVIAWFAGP